MNIKVHIGEWTENYIFLVHHEMPEKRLLDEIGITVLNKVNIEIEGAKREVSILKNKKGFLGLDHIFTLTSNEIGKKSIIQIDEIDFKTIINE